MQLYIGGQGRVSCLYDEALDLTALGTLSIKRVSHVEPDDEGRWWADLAPVAGPILGPCDRRSDALLAERAWLETHWPYVGKYAQGHAQASDRKHDQAKRRERVWKCAISFSKARMRAGHRVHSESKSAPAKVFNKLKVKEEDFNSEKISTVQDIFDQAGNLLDGAEACEITGIPVFMLEDGE